MAGAQRPAPFPTAKQRTPIQAYRIVSVANQNGQNYGLNYDLRVSDDGKMAVRDTANTTPNGNNQYQDLYLTQEVLQASQQILANIGSGVALTQTATTITGRPKASAQNRTLYKVTITFADTPHNESYEDCDANMGNILGTSRNLQNTNRTLNAALEKKLNGSKLMATQGVDLDPYAALRRKITGQANRSEAKTDWEGMTDTKRNAASKKYGINQYARPEAGEGIGIFKAGTTGNPGITAGHFAGVIARSGSDYITLENYAGNLGTIANPGARINPNWYVRMFGGKTGQSFYEFHKANEAADYGSQPMAIRFRGV
jgi:hypothetical protein